VEAQEAQEVQQAQEAQEAEPDQRMLESKQKNMPL